MTLQFGYSPCPNDTFMFWAWVHGLVETPISIEPALADIQALNVQALNPGRLPLTKISMATYLRPEIRKHYRLLSSGSALGRSCGPLVVGQRPWDLDRGEPIRVAIPGRDTTAFRLAQIALGQKLAGTVELRYDQIMPAVVNGEVEAGVIIHESRFSYADLGLCCILDLGDWWEKKTGCPLPLGLMVATKSLSEGDTRTVELALRSSIEMAQHALADPSSPGHESLWAYLRTHAIELEDSTMRQHIELYVNAFSKDLGEDGRKAIQAFQELSSAYAD